VRYWTHTGVLARSTYVHRAVGMSPRTLRVSLPGDPNEDEAEEDAGRVFAFLDKMLPATVMAKLAVLFLAVSSCAQPAEPQHACDADDLAAEYRAAGQVEAEISMRSLLVQSGDPLDQYNLICALADGGYPVTVSDLRDCAARIAPGDELLPHVLFVLADEVDDPDEASALRAQAEDLMYGQDLGQEGTAALQEAGDAEDPWQFEAGR